MEGRDVKRNQPSPLRMYVLKKESPPRVGEAVMTRSTAYLLLSILRWPPPRAVAVDRAAVGSEGSLRMTKLGGVEKLVSLAARRAAPWVRGWPQAAVVGSEGTTSGGLELASRSSQKQHSSCRSAGHVQPSSVWGSERRERGKPIAVDRLRMAARMPSRAGGRVGRWGTSRSHTDSTRGLGQDAR